MTTNPLSQVPRELAERLFFESILPLITSGDLDTIQVRVEAVIREAMQLARQNALHEAAEHLRGKADTFRPTVGRDTRLCEMLVETLRLAATAIESLKPKPPRPH